MGRLMMKVRLLMMKVRLRDKSGIRLYRYLVEGVDRHGRVRIYFRRKAAKDPPQRTARNGGV